MSEVSSRNNRTNNHVIAAESSNSTISVPVPDIPIEIVSEEEMAFIEAALAATHSSLPSNTTTAISAHPRSFLFLSNARSISSITALSKRRLSSSSSSSSPGACCEPDIEDSGDFSSTQKRNKAAESFLLRFRKKRGLSVTDVTSTEWCEKQMEYVLTFRRRETNTAMKAGSARHVQLEEEVVKKVKVSVCSFEDSWALDFINFITGANQLMSEGLTRELPLIGFAEGVPLVGKVDEIRMPRGKVRRNPILMETKTRVRASLPAESQRRNARLQLMCYKYLWDNSVTDKFPFRQFFHSFSLNPYHILSQEVRENAAKAGTPAKTLGDIVRYYRNICSKLLPADNQMLLRYELQKDNSVLGEDHFKYDLDWLKSQIQGCLEFWMGEREASYAPEGERWKCRSCQFSSVCPVNANSDASSHAEADYPTNSPS